MGSQGASVGSAGVAGHLDVPEAGVGEERGVIDGSTFTLCEIGVELHATFAKGVLVTPVMLKDGRMVLWRAMERLCVQHSDSLSSNYVGAFRGRKRCKPSHVLAKIKHKRPWRRFPQVTFLKWIYFVKCLVGIHARQHRQQVHSKHSYTETHTHIHRHILPCV